MVTVVVDARVNCQRSAGMRPRQCPAGAEVESFPATVCPSCIVPPPTVVRTMVPLDALQLFPSLDSAMRFVSSPQSRRNEGPGWVVDGFVAAAVREEPAFAAKAGTERLPASKTLL